MRIRSKAIGIRERCSCTERAYLRVVDKKTDGKGVCARRLKERRHLNVAAVALAAQPAPIAWAMLAKGSEYRRVVAEEAVA